LESENPTQSYTLTIIPKDSFFKSDMDIISIIKYLDVIGEITHLQLEDEQIPSIDRVMIRSGV